jgi:hypothetical protein
MMQVGLISERVQLDNNVQPMRISNGPNSMGGIGLMKSLYLIVSFWLNSRRRLSIGVFSFTRSTHDNLGSTRTPVAVTNTVELLDDDDMPLSDCERGERENGPKRVPIYM